MSEAKHTEFAMKAVDLGELFLLMCGSDVLRTAQGDYTAQLSVPEGLSTGGGKQALQHVMLVPEDAGTTLVVGNVSQTDKTVALRTYAHAAAIYKQRTHRPFGVGRADFDDLTRKMTKFFEGQGLTVTTEPYDPEAAAAARRVDTEVPGASSNNTPLVVTVILIAVIIAAAFLLTRGAVDHDLTDDTEAVPERDTEIPPDPDPLE